MEKKFVFFVGPVRCGTTWLYEMFKENTNCSYIKGKEIYYFEKETPFNKNDYLANFTHRDNFYIDISPTYIESSAVAMRIKKNFNNATIVVILKKTSDIAFSQFLYMKKNGYNLKTLNNFLSDDVFLPVRDKLKYENNLPQWKSIFNSNEILFLDFNDFKVDNISYFSKLCSSLGISCKNPIKNVGVVNDSVGSPKNLIFYRSIVRLGRFAAKFFNKEKLNYFRTKIVDYLLIDKKNNYQFSKEETQMCVEYYKNDCLFLDKIKKNCNMLK